MAAKMTLVQTIGVATGSWPRPMHAAPLRKLYASAGKPLSLDAVRDKLEARRNIVILQVRNSAILAASPDLAALQSNWTSLNAEFVPTQAALASFIKLLQANGVSTVKIAPDWRTIAVSGPTSAFAAIPTQYYLASLSDSVSTQSSGLKLLGGPVQAAAGGGLVAGGAVTAGAGGSTAAGWTTATLFGAGSTAAGTAGSTGAAFGAGAAADTAAGAAAASGPIGWALLAIGVGAIALGVYLLSSDSSSSGSTAPANPGSNPSNPTPSPTDPSGSDNNTAPSGSGGNEPNSMNETPGYPAADGTQVYGATSPTDATAIANALSGQAGVDATGLPPGPPQGPICPALICPTDPLATVAVTDPTPTGTPNDPSGCPNAPFGICPSDGLPLTPGELAGGGSGCPEGLGEEEG